MFVWLGLLFNSRRDSSFSLESTILPFNCFLMKPFFPERQLPFFLSGHFHEKIIPVFLLQS